jgi:hypothetical protein
MFVKLRLKQIVYFFIEQMSIPEAPKTFEERLESFQTSYITFLKEQFTANFKTIHLWRGIGQAQNSCVKKVQQLANKEFRGMLTRESLCHLDIALVVHLFVAVRAFESAKKDHTLEELLTFLEAFIKESCEAMPGWNWILTRKDESLLQDYRDYDFEEDEPATGKFGFPSWIKVCVGDDCDCCFDSESEEESESESEEEKNDPVCMLCKKHDPTVKTICCDCSVEWCQTCVDENEFCKCYGECDSCGSQVNRGEHGWPCSDCKKWLCDDCREQKGCDECK